ncbi:MAG: DUF4331 family protein [Candidatus Eiseniibacteriota bacterium]
MSRRILLFPGVTALLAALVLFPGISAASSHSEAPGTAKDRLGDDTDLYAFVSPDAPNAVTFVGLWVPLLEPAGGPNFYSFDDEAHYYVNIDNVGDAQDRIRYRFSFRTERRNGATFLYNTNQVTSLDDPDLNVRQFWTLTRVDNGSPAVIAEGQVAPQFVGPVSMPDYASLAQAAVTTLGDGTKIFVGPRDDPFFVDLGAVFDLLTIRKVPGNKGKGIDAVSGFNVMAVVLQVPFTRLTSDGQAPNSTNSVIGIYDSVERPQSRTINGDGTATTGGPFVQVSRLGHPLVNEVVIPLQDKDRFNATKPPGDGAFLNYVTMPEFPGLLNLLYSISVPPTPRLDLVNVFLFGLAGLNKPNNPNQVPCEMLRLNMAVPPSSNPSRFGALAGDVAGFPNGRRLADDAVDIVERVAAGVLVDGFNITPNNQLGDGVDANDKPFLPFFPYAALPHNPLDNRHYSAQAGGSASATGSRAISLMANTVGGSLELAGGNPASSHVLQYSVPQTARVSVRIYNAAGRLVRTVLDQDAAAGSFRATWDGRSEDGASAPKGVYFARYTTNGAVSDTKKLILD